MDRKKVRINTLQIYMAAGFIGAGLSFLIFSMAWPDFGYLSRALVKAWYVLAGGGLFFIGVSALVEGHHSKKYWSEHNLNLSERISELERRVK